MRKRKRIILIVILTAITALALYLVAPAKKATLNNPQSIVYDATNEVHYLSNSGSNSIMSMDAEGIYLPFVTDGLNQPRGLIMSGANLWVVEPKRVTAIDLQKKTVAYHIDVPEAKNLTDIAADENGLLYVTDTDGDCLWIINPSTREMNKISDPRMSKPTGIVYDSPRYQMLLVSGVEYSPIYVFDIISQSIDIYMDTLYGDLRGIAIDPETGAVYFSSLKQQMIVEITLAKNRPEPFIRDISGAGDFIHDLALNVLRVPMMNDNQVRNIPLKQEVRP